MIERLEKIDQELFLYLNSIHSEFMDQFMWFVSGKIEWIPLYLVLIYFIIKNYKKLSWIIFIGIALSILLADQFSVKLFKEVFERYRPCHNFDIGSMVHIVNQKCGGKFGFVSSHAANSFATAVFVGTFLKPYYRLVLPLVMIWASLVSYSRIYLGVHYPSDVIGGAVLGSLLALIVARFVNNWLKIYQK